MKPRIRIGKFATSLLLVFAAACQTAGAAEDALLLPGDADALTVLQTTLAGAMNIASVELGPEDPTQSSVISVLPPRPGALEDRSLAQPTQFRIVLKNGRCHVMRVDSGAHYDSSVYAVSQPKQRLPVNHPSRQSGLPSQATLVILLQQLGEAHEY